jgi:hypothetical protein
MSGEQAASGHRYWPRQRGVRFLAKVLIPSRRSRGGEARLDQQRR